MNYLPLYVWVAHFPRGGSQSPVVGMVCVSLVVVLFLIVVIHMMRNYRK